MNEINETAKIAGEDPVCPKCGGKGRVVRLVTLKALLKPEAQTRLLSASYRFCPSEDCEVVYFSEPGSFTKADLTVPVGIKEKTPPRQVCYCFNHTIEEIEEEVRLTGRTTVLDDIKSRMKIACWCETKSPLGSCCLATVTQYARQALERHGKSGETVAAAASQNDCCAAPGHAMQVPAGNKEPTPLHAVPTAEKVAWMGSIFSAVLASACCWLPLILMAFGVSGVAVSAVLAKHRSFFMLAAFASLGSAFYFAYRPRSQAAHDRARQEGDSCCMAPAAGNDCCSSTGRRWTLQKFNRTMLWVVTAITLAFVFFPNYVGALLGGSQSQDAGFTTRFQNVETRTLAIEGMTCEACAIHLQANLAKVPGVRSAEIHYKEQKAVVVADLSVNQDVLVKAVESAGYKVATEIKPTAGK